MLLKSEFEVTEIANEYLVIPVGNEATLFNGVVALNEAAASLVKKMKLDVSKDELVDTLLKEYDVDKDIAEKDVDNLVAKLFTLGIIKEN